MNYSAPKEIVAYGYDRIAARYAAWSVTVRADERARYTDVLLKGLPAGSKVLELGCGNGLPTTRLLSERFAVTGVDISPVQVELARRSVPAAEILRSDMTTLEFPAARFDGVAAFYSITHVPRNEHAPLLASIVRWLRPGGLFVAAMGANASEGAIEEDWLGAPMFFSHHDAETNRAMVEDACFRIVTAQVEVAEEDGVPSPFLWIVARTPEG